MANQEPTVWPGETYPGEPRKVSPTMGGWATNTVFVSGPGLLPKHQHENDAGFDLFCYLDAPIWLQPLGEPGDSANVPCGISIEVPDHLYGLITPRSSTLNRGLHVVQAVIDPGYRGELFARVKNLVPEQHTIRHGERIAQLLVLPNIAPSIRMVGVESLSPSARGEQGFGSTGR